MSNADNWQREYSEEGPELKIFRARFDFMRNARNGLLEKMIVLESPDAVNVVACTPQHKILFVRQYRFGIGQDTLELPGGIVDPGETHDTGAMRELREETGYSGTLWTYLGNIASNPVFQDSYIHHWLLEDALETHTIQLDAGETVHVEALPVNTVRDMLLHGAFKHPHTISGLLRYFAFKKMF